MFLHFYVTFFFSPIEFPLKILNTTHIYELPQTNMNIVFRFPIKIPNSEKSKWNANKTDDDVVDSMLLPDNSSSHGKNTCRIPIIIYCYWSHTNNNQVVKYFLPLLYTSFFIACYTIACVLENGNQNWINSVFDIVWFDGSHY